MYEALQVLVLMLIALAMALALAHALELPGKMRLDKEAYFAVQPIYYPGFTVGGGIGEGGGTLVTLLLLLLTPSGSAALWWTLVALLGLLGMQAVYWLVTHPVNGFWLEGEDLGRFGSGFFSIGAKKNADEHPRPAEWTELRDRWEYSHVARAVLSCASFLAIVLAVSRGT